MIVDKNKKYYKVINEKGHYGVKYKLGLNIDPLPFNPNKDDECVEGGIYFSDSDDVFHYFHYGDYVAEIEIPADAKVCVNDNWDKARADKIIINKIMSKKEFISWLIENNQFNWEEYSETVVEYCPEKLDPEKFNWQVWSHYVAEYCPDKLVPEKYNWKRYSWFVAVYCPEKIDTERFNWKESSWAVAEHCPDKLDTERFNWGEHSWVVAEFCPEKIDTEKYNWQAWSHYVAKFCPEKMKLRPKNKGGDNESR